jgi:hypothetical protein
MIENGKLYVLSRRTTFELSADLLKARAEGALHGFARQARLYGVGSFAIDDGTSWRGLLEPLLDQL